MIVEVQKESSDLNARLLLFFMNFGLKIETHMAIRAICVSCMDWISFKCLEASPSIV